MATTLQTHYNHERPSQALDRQTPAEEVQNYTVLIKPSTRRLYKYSREYTVVRRRDILIGLATSTTFALAGCSNNSDNSSNPGSDEETQETQETQESEGDLGKTRVTQDDVRLTVTDAFTTTELNDDYEYITPKDGNRLLLVKLQVRNNADEAKLIPTHSDLSVRDADNIRQTQITSSNTELVEPVSNTYTPPTSFDGDAEIEPGTQIKGWLGYSISTDKTDIRTEFPSLLTKSSSDSGGETVAWDISLPEQTGVAFEEIIKMPSDPRAGNTSEVTATVTNNGIRRGRVERHYTVYTYRDVDTNDSITGSIDANSSQEVTLEFTPFKTGVYTFESPRTDYENFQVTPRTFIYGDTWDVPTGLNITLSDPVLVDSITYNSSEGTNLKATPSSGNQFLVFNYTADSDETHYWEPKFVATENGKSISTTGGNMITDIIDGYDEELIQPLSGTPIALDTNGYNFPNRNGPMVMEVPDSFTLSEMEIRMEETSYSLGGSSDPEDQYAAVWTAD